jgi:O-antigen ligase
MSNVINILYSRFALYVMWGLYWILIIIIAMKVPVIALLRPIVPFLLWMLGYLCWGWIAATYPVSEDCYRIVFRFGSVVAGLAIVTSHPRRWATFANATQFLLVGQLLIIVIVMIYPEYQNSPIFDPTEVNLESERFGGLWGNANVAALMTLLILMLSYWANRWVALLGQITGCTIIYLTASRTGNFILVALILLYILFGVSSLTRMKIVLAATLVLFAGGWYIGYEMSMGYEGSRRIDFIRENKTFSRLLDIQESKTREARQETRADVVKEWIPFILREPWYGYGLNSMMGRERVESENRRAFPIGIHNLYLGILIDVGLTGLLTFLIVIGWQLTRIYKAPLDPPIRRMLFALCFITLIFALANHNLVSDYAGWFAFSLIFLLPSSPALRWSRVVGPGRY